MPATQTVVRGVPLEQRAFVAGGIAVACGGLGLFAMWRGASALPAFGVFGVIAACLIAVAFADSLAAGEGWLGGAKRYVRTDELQMLALKRRRDGAMVDMRDRGGRRLRTSLRLLRSDARLWQLVRDGVARSLAAGCAAGDDVRRAFG